MIKTASFYLTRKVCLRWWQSVVPRLFAPNIINVTLSRWHSSNGLTQMTICVASPFVWQIFVKNIQEAVANSNNVEAFLRFCRLWRTHFPQPTSREKFFVMLEKELVFDGDKKDTTVAGDSDTTAKEPIPRDLLQLPVFLQALSAAAQLGQKQLKLFHTLRGSDQVNEEDAKLIASVVPEICEVVFYLARTRLTDTLYATHYRLVELADMHSETVVTKDIISKNSSFSSRDEERVSCMGVRLNEEEMRQALELADTSAAVLAINPPLVLLPTLYRLLLPVLGASEQLDNHRLGALATVVARAADFSELHDVTGAADFADQLSLAETGRCGVDSAALRPVMTSYTVLSHLHAIARSLEVRMQGAVERAENTRKKKMNKGNCEGLQKLSFCDAQLRLLSLKERKALEKQRGAAVGQFVGTGDSSVVEADLVDSVAVVCSALAARRYADDRFWGFVTEFTVCTLRESCSISDVLQFVRDVLFALDHVNQKEHFDRIMELLVRLKVLKEPILPPSAAAKTMKHVKCCTTATFDQQQVLSG